MLYERPVNPETGERVYPSELESHRRTHYFLAPCCLCAPALNEVYVESCIALVHVPSGGPGALLNGEYIAECALRQCGYFGESDFVSTRRFLLIVLYPMQSLWRKFSRSRFCTSSAMRSEVISKASIISKPIHLTLHIDAPLPAEQSAYITDFNTHPQESSGLYQALPVSKVFSRGGRKGASLLVTFPLSLAQS